MSNSGWVTLSVVVSAGAALATGTGTVRILIENFRSKKEVQAPRPSDESGQGMKQPVDVTLTDSDGTVHHMKVRTESEARDALRRILAQVGDQREAEEKDND